MNVETLRQKLLAAARSNPPSDKVPLAFEKRIMARLAESPAFDFTAAWARSLWRAVVPCVALTVLISVWSFVNIHNNSSPNTKEGYDFAQHFERTMLAGMDEQLSEEN